MFNGDYNQEYERRQKIKRTAVIVENTGADFNAVWFMNKAGNVLGRPPKMTIRFAAFEIGEHHSKLPEHSANSGTH